MSTAVRPFTARAHEQPVHRTQQPLGWHQAPYTDADVAKLRARASIEYSVARLGARTASGSSFTSATTSLPRRAHRQHGGADGARRPRGDLPLGLAGRGRRQHRRPDVPRPVPSTRSTRCRRSCASTTRSSAPTRSTHAEGKRRATLVRPMIADAEAGFGGPLNAYELAKGHDRGGRRRAFTSRTSSRRESAVTWAARCSSRPPQFIRTPHAARLAADVWACPRCSSPAPTRTARSSSRATSTSATPVHRPRRGRRGLLSHQERRRLRHRARPRLRPYADLWVRDLHARPRAGEEVRRGRPQEVPRTRCSRTTARRSTGRRTSTTRRSPSSRPSSARWATSSSSSRWRASTPSTSGCSTSPPVQDGGMAAYYRSCSRPSSRRRRTATPRRATSARSSIRSPRSSPGGKSATLALGDSTEKHQF